MTVIGFILLIGGALGGLLLFTGAAGPLLPTLSKMPLGLKGWGIVAVAGLILVILNRRTAD